MQRAIPVVGCYTVPMYVVTLLGPSADAADSVAALAEVLGVTAYEARARTQVPGGGPAIVGTRPDAAQAEDLAARLGQAGFPVLTRDAAIASEVSALEARTFALDPESLHIGTRHGEQREIPWETVQLVIRGTSSVRETTKTEIKERRLSVGRALATGGLVMGKTHKTERVSTTTTSEGFVVIYSTAQPPVSLREHGLQYQSLGAKMQPSRAANFNLLVAELRRSAPAAIFEDRLLRRAVQQQILGPSLDADDRLDLAVALVARAHGVGD